MWYIGPGWFFSRDRDGAMRILVLDTELARPHEQARLLAQNLFPRELWVQMLAAVTGRTQAEVEEFWGPAAVR